MTCVSVRLTIIAVLALTTGCTPPTLHAPRPPSVPAGTAATRATLPTPNNLQTLLRAGRFEELDRSLAVLQRQYEQGLASDEDLRDTYRAFYPTDPQLEAKYNSWIERFPKSYVAHLARAVYYRHVASAQRGSAYIDRTTDEQIHNMESTLKEAAQDIQVSLELTPKPVLSLAEAIDIAGMLGAPDHGRALLDRAISLDPKAFIERVRYMGNLQTRWGGSLEEMQSFMEESRHSRLSQHQFDLLESLVVEEQGWLHIHEDGDTVAAMRDYERAKSLNPDLCLRCAKLEVSELLRKQRKYQEAAAALTGVLDSDPSDLVALNMRAQAYSDAGMLREAVADWRKSAEAGNAAAQIMIGGFYMNGIPGLLEADTNTGIEWFRKAAAQGDPYGKDNLERAQRFVAAKSPAAGPTTEK